MDIFKEKRIEKIFVIFVFIFLTLLFSYERYLAFKPLDDNLHGLDPYIFYRYALLLRLGKFSWNDTYRYYPRGFEVYREMPMTYLVIYSLSFITEKFLDKSKFSTYEDYVKEAVMKAAQIYPFIASVLGFLFLLLFVYEYTGSIIPVIVVGIALSAGGSQFLFRTIPGWADKEPLAFLETTMFLFFYYRFLSRRKLIYAIISAFLIVMGVLTWGGFIFTLVLFNLFFLIDIIRRNGKVDQTDIIAYSFLFFLLVGLSYTPFAGFAGGHGILNVIKAAFYDVRKTLCLTPFFITLILFLLDRVKELRNIFEKIHNYLSRTVEKLCGLNLFRNRVITLLFLLSVLALPKILKKFWELLLRVKPEYALSTVAESQPPSSPAEVISNLTPIAIYLPLILFILTDIYKFYFTKERAKYFYVFNVILYGLFLLTFLLNQWSLTSILFGILTVLLFLEYSINVISEEYLLASFSYLFSIVACLRAVRLYFTSIFFIAFSLSLSLIIFMDTLSGILKEILKIAEHKELSRYIVVGLTIFIVFSYSRAYLDRLRAMPYVYPSITGNYKEAFVWLRENTPENSVIIHWWDYGYWTLAVAERKAVVDGGNAFPKRNEDIARYLFNAKNDTELYCLLKKYGKPDYLVIVSSDLFKFYQISRWAHWRDPNYGKPVSFFVFPYIGDSRVGNTKYKVFGYSLGGTRLRGITMNLLFEKPVIIEGKVITPDDYLVGIFYSKNDTKALILRRNGERILVNLTCVCERYRGCKEIGENSLPFCFLPLERIGIIIPGKARDVLFTKIFLLGLDHPALKLVKEIGDLETGILYNMMGSNYLEYIRIWKINYTYFEREFENETIDCSFVYRK